MSHKKRSGESYGPPIPKRNRKPLTLKEKLDILHRYDSGERAVDISNSLNFPSSTVRTIIQMREKIKEFSKTATPLDAKCLFKTNRSPIMVDMERILTMWITNQTQTEMPLSAQLIQEMARNIYEDLKKDYSGNSNIEPFKASAGWFERFKRRAKLLNVAARSEPDKVSVEVKPENTEIMDALYLIGEGLFILHESDPDKERSSSVCKVVSKAIECYKEVYKPAGFVDFYEKKSNVPCQLFISSCDSLSNHSQPGPSSQE